MGKRRYNTIDEILEIPISNLNIVINTGGYIALLDICKEQFFKVNFFNFDLPYDGNIGEIEEIIGVNNNKGLIENIFTPFTLATFNKERR